jgi:DNA-binding IscR family transcriptional regulator
LVSLMLDPTPSPPSSISPHDRVLAAAVDDDWRTAREIADRAAFPRPLAAAALRRLRQARLVESRKDMTGRNGQFRLLYRLRAANPD